MPYGLYISAEGAHAQTRRLETIANNLANVETPGFKRELALLQARNAEAIRTGRVTPGQGAPDEVGGGVRVRETRIDMAQGPLKATGSMTDMALRCDGFFTVRRGQETLLTRAGNFRLNPRGELVTQEGDAVLGDGGVPITITRPNAPWEVTPTGEIRQGNETQRLAIVRPDHEESLQKVGENLFRAAGGVQPLWNDNRQVLAEHLEMSSAHATTEMIDLIEASRAIEANVNMMQTQDQMLSGLFNRLMRV